MRALAITARDGAPAVVEVEEREPADGEVRVAVEAASINRFDLAVAVGYVWDQKYGPLKWPKKRTTVFEVDSPRPLYWKAASLSEFEIDHWQESPSLQGK